MCIRDSLYCASELYCPPGKAWWSWTKRRTAGRSARCGRCGVSTDPGFARNKKHGQCADSVVYGLPSLSVSSSSGSQTYDDAGLLQLLMGTTGLSISDITLPVTPLTIIKKAPKKHFKKYHIINIICLMINVNVYVKKKYDKVITHPSFIQRKHKITKNA